MTLKTIFLNVIVAAVSISCQVEVEPEGNEDFAPGPGRILAVSPFVDAESETIGTRIGYGDAVDGKYPVVWTKGDIIKLYGASERDGKDYGYEASEKIGMGVFTGPSVVGDSRCAVYPSTRAMGFSDDLKLCISFGSLRKQKSCSSLIGNAANLKFLPMWAKEGEGDKKGMFVFNNLCGALSFSFSDLPVSVASVTISSKTRYISGLCMLDPLTGEMEFVNENSSKESLEKSVTVICDDGFVLGEDGIIVSLPAGRYEANDLTVTFTDSSRKTYSKTITSPLNVLPGVLRTFPALSVPYDLSVVWEAPQLVKNGTSGVSGGYPRVHRLDDGRLMLSYSANTKGQTLFSSDNGVTWSDRKTVMQYINVTNGAGKARLTAAAPDFAQLSKNHPKHPGRIIYACNYRPRELKSDDTLGEKGWTTVAPYTISISVSDDNGQTWSKQNHLYESMIWQTNVTVGCWEPFVLELPDGTVQIYFADETPYYATGSSRHNISVIESKDGGDTWGSVRIVAQNEDNRDGMPVAVLFEDNILLAVESTDGIYGRLHPIVICNPIKDCWKTTVGKNSSYRFHPFEKSLKSNVVYSGAPYIITTDNYVVYSYQISDWYPAQSLKEAKEYNNNYHSTLEVQVCPKIEINDGYFHTMRTPSRPIPLDQATEQAVWNSLCDLGNDEILAVSQYNNKIYSIRGKIVASFR